MKLPSKTSSKLPPLPAKTSLPIKTPTLPTKTIPTKTPSLPTKSVSSKLSLPPKNVPAVPPKVHTNIFSDTFKGPNFSGPTLSEKIFGFPYSQEAETIGKNYLYRLGIYRKGKWFFFDGSFSHVYGIYKGAGFIINEEDSLYDNSLYESGDEDNEDEEKPFITVFYELNANSEGELIPVKMICHAIFIPELIYETQDFWSSNPITRVIRRDLTYHPTKDSKIPSVEKFLMDA